MEKGNLQKSYQEAGVDPQKAHHLLKNMLQKIPHTSPLPPHFFCQLLPLEKDEYLALATDGVGTKILLAIEYGYLQEIGYDLVGMVYNDLITSGARGTAFLDYFSTGKLSQKTFPIVLDSIYNACKAAGMELLGGETAEMPGLYQEGHFDLAGFGVGRVSKHHLLGPHRVKEGDLLFGLPASGFHSNGYSLIRKTIEEKKLDLEKPIQLDGVCQPLGLHLLKGTQIYVQLQRAWEEKGIYLAACAHITGGGIYENLPRILPQGFAAYLKKKFFPGLELLAWFQELKGLSLSELVSIFHGGYGMVLIVPEEKRKNLENLFPSAPCIGWIEKGKEPINWVT